jgi:hypothetical protein
MSLDQVKDDKDQDDIEECHHEYLYQLKVDKYVKDDQLDVINY